MGTPIDANRTQAKLIWSQIDWRKIEKTVLRLQHRIFMAKVKGDVKGMESLQRLLASSRAAKLLAIRKVGQENRGRRTPGVDGVVSISDAHRERLSVLDEYTRHIIPRGVSSMSAAVNFTSSQNGRSPV